jgi:hypothetical protein
MSSRSIKEYYYAIIFCQDAFYSRMHVRKRLEKLSEELLESFTALVCLWAAPNRVFTKVLVNR